MKAKPCTVLVTRQHLTHLSAISGQQNATAVFQSPGMFVCFLEATRFTLDSVHYVSQSVQCSNGRLVSLSFPFTRTVYVSVNWKLAVLSWPVTEGSCPKLAAAWQKHPQSTFDRWLHCLTAADDLNDECVRHAHLPLQIYVHSNNGESNRPPMPLCAQSKYLHSRHPIARFIYCLGSDYYLFILLCALCNGNIN